MATESIRMNGDADRGDEAGEFHRENRIMRRRGPLNMNHYANKKSAAESMLDVALLMANASQLKAVLEHGPSFTFYVPLITLLSISLILQVLVGVMLIFIVKWNLNDERMHHKLDILESCVMAFIFVIVVVNVFITAFGVQQPHSQNSPPS
ncbi:ninjurin-1 [Poecilia latipinna]|uniref:Ninjurin 1 n=3 Tax=Poecilia TaxID=8080 RepID=A0A087YLG6_POEFO|nr:PREDICTED: ninjurin-1-like [Poecilia formosa]XP_014842957.1 PREDICTED: ninjurin-1 [Poecilia mexicana]XP_014884211.1 PREDICTED: ninjurin-1-like [Poecilia latipinna]